MGTFSISGINLNFTFLSNKIPAPPLLAQSAEIWNGREEMGDKRQFGREFWLHVEGWAEAKYLRNQYYILVFFNGKKRGFSPHLETNRSWALQTGASLSYFPKIAAFPKETTPLKIPDSDKASISQSSVPICIQARGLTLDFYSATEKKIA